MSDRTTLLLLTGILFLLFSPFNFLVWFRYSRCEKWIKRAKDYAVKSNLPFSGFYSSFLISPSYKWFARIVLLFMLIACAIPWVLMLFG